MTSKSCSHKLPGFELGTVTRCVRDDLHVVGKVLPEGDDGVFPGLELVIGAEGVTRTTKLGEGLSGRKVLEQFLIVSLELRS